MKYKLDFYDTARLAKKNNYPAPGTYEDQTALSRTGNYVTSEMVSSKAAKWGKDEKLKPPGNKFYPTPGVGYYEHLGNIGDMISHVSHFHTISGPAKNFGTDKRNYLREWTNRHMPNPGPGTYVPPSDFGYTTLTFSHKSQIKKSTIRSLEGTARAYNVESTRSKSR